jgi:hypothetical protein
MKEPAHGPTEILCFPDGHKTIVTRSWWGKFLSEQESRYNPATHEARTKITSRSPFHTKVPLESHQVG